MPRRGVSIADELLHWTTVRGYTAAGLSMAARINRSSMSDYFHGHNCSRENIDKICTVLTVSVEEFLGEKIDLYHASLTLVPVKKKKYRYKSDRCGIERVLKMLPGYLPRHETKRILAVAKGESRTC